MSYTQVTTKWLKSLSGLYSRLLLYPLVLTGGVRLAAFIGLMSLAGCSSMTPLGLLTGSGPNVAANVQAGRTNTQTIGTTQNYAPTASVRPNGRVGTIDQSNSTSTVSTDAVSTIVVNEIPVWMVLLFGLLCGFLIPSPSEIARGVISFFRISKRRK